MKIHNRYKIIEWMVLFVVAVTMLEGELNAKDSSQNRPNFLIIMVDDISLLNILKSMMRIFTLFTRMR